LITNVLKLKKVATITAATFTNLLYMTFNNYQTHRAGLVCPAPVAMKR